MTSTPAITWPSQPHISVCREMAREPPFPGYITRPQIWENIKKFLLFFYQITKKDGVQNHGQARPERNLQDQIKETFRTILRAPTPDSWVRRRARPQRILAQREIFKILLQSFLASHTRQLRQGRLKKNFCEYTDNRNPKKPFSPILSSSISSMSCTVNKYLPKNKCFKYLYYQQNLFSSDLTL